jgi:signal transduction histidine kinase
MTTAVMNDQLAMLMHDLRSPLATVHRYTQLLLRQAEGRQGEVPGLSQSLRHIQDAAWRLERLVDQLAGTPTVPCAGKVNLVELAHRIAAQSEPQAGFPTRVMVLSDGVSELVGNWDTTALERLLGNLLDNALKYSAADLPVVVMLRREGTWAILAVADRGIGIPSVDLSNVFEPGYRARNAADLAPGRGIGLSGVRDIVQAHRSFISVDSQEGVGTTVTVRLPLPELKELC